MIFVADVLQALRWLDENSAQCVVTSPPYWGLRDYGISGQLGLEKTFDEYVERVVIIFREVRRVLRRDGTLWLNMGDCYNAGGRGGSHGGKSTLEGGQENQNASMRYPRKAPTTGVDVGGWNDAEIDGGARVVHHGLKPKDLVGMPWRIAFALQADGWWLRSEIIWEKPNPMPESVTDRPTRSHEQIFLLSKSARYYYDQDAIREPWADGRQGRDYPQPNAPDKIKSPYGQGFTRRAKVPSGWDTSIGENQGRHHNKHGRYRPERERNRGGRTDGFTKPNQIDPSENGGKNARTVWRFSTEPYPEAHFATFPLELPRRCILAGSRPGDLVLDPFCGSGTTLLAADMLGRDHIGIELNPAYAALAQARLTAPRSDAEAERRGQEAAGQTTLFQESQ